MFSLFEHLELEKHFKNCNKKAQLKVEIKS